MRAVGSQELGRASKETFFSRNRSAVGLGASLALAAAGVGSLIYVTMHLRKEDDQKQERKDESPSMPPLQKKNEAALVQTDGISWQRTRDGILIEMEEKRFSVKLSCATVIDSIEYAPGQQLHIIGSLNLGIISKKGTVTVEAKYMDAIAKQLRTMNEAEAEITVPYTLSMEPEAEPWRQAVLDQCVAYASNPACIKLTNERPTTAKNQQLPVTLVMNKSGE